MEPTTASASIFTLANAKWLLVAGIPLAIKVLWDYFSIKRDVKEVKTDNKEIKADNEELKANVMVLMADNKKILSKLDRNSEEHKEVISRLDKVETIVDERTEKKV